MERNKIFFEPPNEQAVRSFR